MFGVAPLARIVRNDARIEVKVPAAQGRKAYSYFREGGEGEKKPSGVGKKVALIGGGLALAGLGAAAIAMNRKKTETGGVAAPISEPKKGENNTARNVAIGAGVAGLGVAATKIATSKRKEAEKPEGTENQESEDKAESLEDIAKKPDTAHVLLVVEARHLEGMDISKPLDREGLEKLISKSPYLSLGDFESSKDKDSGLVFREEKEGSERHPNQEMYIRIAIPESPDLVSYSKDKGKNVIPYYVKQSIPSGAKPFAIGKPRPLRNLYGLEKFTRI